MYLASPILQTGEIPEEILCATTSPYNWRAVGSWGGTEPKNAYCMTLADVAERLRFPVGEIMDEIDVMAVVVVCLQERVTRTRRIVDHWRRFALRRALERERHEKGTTGWIPEVLPAQLYSCEVPEDDTLSSSSTDSYRRASTEACNSSRDSLQSRSSSVSSAASSILPPTALPNQHQHTDAFPANPMCSPAVESPQQLKRAAAQRTRNSLAARAGARLAPVVGPSKQRRHFLTRDSVRILLNEP
ncbi:hypothetical protein DIPPA_32995 [Diplonema papillatum]|nr:hypothetical protein DIPPA_32995 [Diplonema papillatum]